MSNKQCAARDIRVCLLHVNKVVIPLPFSQAHEESKLSDAVAQNRKKTKQAKVTELDLTKIEGNGNFSCPKCGVTISPEDESEEVYEYIQEALTFFKNIEENGLVKADK